MGGFKACHWLFTHSSILGRMLFPLFSLCVFSFQKHRGSPNTLGFGKSSDLCWPNNQTSHIPLSQSWLLLCQEFDGKSVGQIRLLVGKSRGLYKPYVLFIKIRMQILILSTLQGSCRHQKCLSLGKHFKSLNTEYQYQLLPRTE